MKQLNILLIEDNVEDATWVGIQLKKAATVPYTLQACDYFSKAMHMIESNNFSLIILDLCLPDNNGLDTLKEFIRRSNLPIIVYTGMSDALVKEEAFKTGISDYLVKGKTSAEELNRSIMQVMENHGN